MNTPFERSDFRAGWRLTLLVVSVAWVLVGSSGCRAISRYDQSRQSISARRLSRQGLEAMHVGQWDVAESLFASALDITTTDDRAHWGLAESLWQRGERTNALRHMEEAVRLSGSDPRLMRRLARMYLDLDRIEDANRQSLAALGADRTSAEAWALRGECLLAGDDPNAALAAYHRALAIQPQYPEVQIQIAEIYRTQGRYDRLLATIDRLQESVGDDAACPAHAHLLRGIALQQLGRPSDAERCFVEASVSEPDNPEAFLRLASLMIETGRTRAAQEPLAHALRLAPDLPMAVALAKHLEASDTTIASESQGIRR